MVAAAASSSAAASPSATAIGALAASGSAALPAIPPEKEDKKHPIQTQKMIAERKKEAAAAAVPGRPVEYVGPRGESWQADDSKKENLVFCLWLVRGRAHSGCFAVMAFAMTSSTIILGW